MKFLKIKNVGLLDINSFFLIGASTKTNDNSKIGQFGTGLKYAISYFMRNNVKFHLFIGEEEITFKTNKEMLRDKSFDVIYCNDQSMNITTEYGYQWEAWEAIREIWCNAKDEEKYHKYIKNTNSVISGEKNWTTFYIEMNDDITNVVNNWKEFFISQKPIFENDEIAVYDNEGSTSKFYKNGVLIKELEVNSLFNYDVKKAELNELRQYQQNPHWNIPCLLANTSKEVISKFLIFISNKDYREEKKIKYFEDNLDWTWCFNLPSKEVLRSNFSGFLFLHPESNIKSNNKAIKVDKHLFEILKNNGLPCEKVNKSSGSYYGGSKNPGKEIRYKIFNDEPLKNRISNFYKKRNIKIQVETAIPFNEEFEILVEYNKVIFSTDLSKLSDTDLEAICIIGYLSIDKNGIYNSFKKLLKSNINNQHLDKILDLK